MGSDVEFEIMRITEDLYDEVEELYYKYFMHYENICIATNLLASSQAVVELKRLLRAVLNDGVSFAAKVATTGKIAAICCNKILNPSKNINLDETFATFTSPEMRCSGDYLVRMESTYDVYQEWQVDCIMEVEFLACDTNFGKRGLASRLTQHSLDFARSMLQGTLCADEINELPEHIRYERPKAVVSVFTSLYTQKLGTKLGFKSLNTISMKEFSFDGQSFAERVEAIHEKSVFAGLKL